MVLLSLAIIGLLLLTSLIMAQGDENESHPFFVWRKGPVSISPESLSVPNRRLETTTYPYNSYASSGFFFPPYQSESNRLGYGRVENYDTTVLNAGWYTDWGANTDPAHPAGAEYVRTIYLNINNTGTTCGNTVYPHAIPATQASQVTPSLSGDALINNINANPGALWLIGNEMDAPYNGNPIQAELYAELYHDLYTTIKAVDPLAKVAIGAIAQPSPVRREYLDKILNHYQTEYGEAFPTDLWNIHLYNLNETECEWGLALPPFGSPSLANHLSEDDFVAGELLNQTVLNNNVRDFRQWMKDRGYQNTPLIITEYGSLSEPQYSPAYSDEKAAQYLSDTSAWFRSATDASTGYPADGYRLVQMWNWFSTRADHFGGDLFEANGSLSVIGNTFQSETNGHQTPYIDLQVIAPLAAEVTDDNVSLRVFADNQGNSTAIAPTMNYILNDYFTSNFVSSSSKTLSDLPSRYTQTPIYVDKTWVFTPPVAYTATVSLGSTQQEKLLDIYPDLSVDNFEIPAVINWRKSGASEFISTTITLSTTIKNVGTWDSVLTPMAIQLQHPNAITTSHVLTVPILAPQATFTLFHTWVVSDTGQYEATVSVNQPYEPTRELFVDNNSVAKFVLVPNNWIFLPLISR